MAISASPPGRNVARVLDADPDLAARVPAGGRDAARAALSAHAYQVAPGPWNIQTPSSRSAMFGLLVVDGALGHRTGLEHGATLELLGPGDLVQPWVRLDADTVGSPSAAWEVIAPARLLLLDDAFARAAAPWPEVAAGLIHRLVMRTRRLAYQLAANTSPRAEDRILYALWAVADRWGRVCEDGVVIRLSLTHQQIAELVSIRRPSVSTALSRLRADGRLSYSREQLVLHGPVPHAVEDLRKQVALGP